MKKHRAKQFLTSTVALAMTLSLAVPAMAAESKNTMHLSDYSGYTTCDIEVTGATVFQDVSAERKYDYYIEMPVGGTIEELSPTINLTSWVIDDPINVSPQDVSSFGTMASGDWNVLVNNGGYTEYNEFWDYDVTYTNPGFKFELIKPGLYLYGLTLNPGQGPSNYFVVKVTDGSNTPVAYATSYKILVDGKEVKFDAYALRDENNNDTNYLKLRDLASVLNGTSAQFNIKWDGAINIVTGEAYEPNGSEMTTPFSGDKPYKVNSNAISVNGGSVNLDAILLTDEAGSGYTYFKLRDLGEKLGFGVDWDGTNIVITTKTNTEVTHQTFDDEQVKRFEEAYYSGTLSELWRVLDDEEVIQAEIEDTIDTYIMFGLLPENGAELYRAWRTEYHPDGHYVGEEVPQHVLDSFNSTEW